MKTERPDTLEQTIINALLIGDDPTLFILRQQYKGASVKGRKFTGCGFFTHFDVPVVPHTEAMNFVINDVALDVEDIENGASAMLFVRNGVIDFLEIATHTEDWPKDAKLVNICYFKRKLHDSFDELVASDKRYLEVTRRAWIK